MKAWEKEYLKKYWKLEAMHWIGMIFILALLLFLFLKGFKS